MKHIRTFVGIVGLLSLCFNSLQAQELDVITKEKMNFVFEHVDKNKVETGLLSDYGCLLVEPYAYDGTLADTNYVDMGIWKGLYLSMYTTRINNNATLQEPQRVFNNLRNDAPALLCLQYNRLDENAVNKGLLKFENDQLWETGNSGSIYLKRDLFAVALPDVDTYYSQVSFTFRQENFINNLQEMPAQMAIRFTPSSGYQSVIWGQPINYTYTSYGEKEISFRVRFNNGKVLESHAYIQVVQKPIQHANERENEPDEKLTIVKTSNHSGGEVQIKYATFNTTGKLIRPLIIADESDILEALIKEEFDLEYLLTKVEDIKNINKVYDLVYINNNDGFDDIFRNAQLFADAMDQINTKRNTIHDKNFVIGLGMGGLVARYALKEMENKGKTHDVSKFISVNSPHKGFNLPIGLQALIRHIQDIKLAKYFIEDISKEAKSLGSLLDKTAMKQMLIYSIDKKFNYRTEHATFMQQYEAMGMPAQCKNIAVSNGSYLGDNLFQPGERIFEYHYKKGTEGKWWLNFLMLGKAEIKFDTSSNGLKYRKLSRVYYGNLYFHKKILFVPIDIDFNKKTLNSTGDMIALDGAPGSKLSVKKLINANEDISNAFKLSDFCFLPTVSALGLDNWEDKLLSKLYLNTEETNFDKLYAIEENNGYENLSACQNALLEELAPRIKGTNGPIIGETEYKLINLPAMITSDPTITSLFVKWRISNENFKIMPNGDKVIVVPQVSNSTAKLIASLSLDGKTSSDVDSIQLSSGDFNILSDSGDYILRGAGSRFRVNIFSPSSTITWSYMDGIQVKEQKDDYIDIAGCGIFGGWLQADVTVNGAKFSKRVWLGYEALPSDLKISVNRSAWHKDNGEIWYLLHADHKSCVSGETFEWKLKSTYLGGKCAEFYTPNTGGPNKAAPGNGGYTPIDPGIFIPEGGLDMELWYEKNIDALPADYRILICNGNTSYTDVSCSLKSPCRTLDANIVMSFSGEVPAWEVPELELKFGSLYTKGSLNWQSVYLEHTPCNTSKENITWELSVGNGKKPVLSDRRPVEFHMGGDTPTLYRDSVWAAHNEIFIVYSDTESLYSMNWIKCQLKVGDKIFNNRIVWPELKAVVPVVPNPGDEIIWIGGGSGGYPIGRNGISPMSVSASNTPSGLYSIRIYGNYGLVRSFDNVSLDVPFEVDTADLPNGNYYLNVFRDGTLIDQQIIMIQH